MTSKTQRGKSPGPGFKNPTSAKPSTVSVPGLAGQSKSTSHSHARGKKG